MSLRIRDLAERVGGLAGWRRNVIAFSCGILAMATLPPFFLFPLLIPAFTGLYWLIQGASTPRRAFFDGWWWGWGYYMSGLYWFCIALLTDAEKFAWLIPFALFGLTAVIALYQGVACWLFSKLKIRGLTGILVFSVVWTAIEYARGHLFTGFPWNLAGYSFAFSDATLQLASLVGAYGLTWLVVFFGTGFSALGEAGVAVRGARIFVVLLCGTLAAGAAWGALRLETGSGSEPFVPNVKLRLVQANIAQPHKWDPKLQLQGIQEHVRLTQSPGLDHITHVIWPETAVPYVIEPDSPLVEMLGKAVPEDTLLITGALRSQGKQENFQVWNSLVAISGKGEIVGNYDKHKLVPFGEFLPFRTLFPPEWLTPVGAQDFSSGNGAQTLRWNGLPPFSPLICYEAIFPELAVDADDRPHVLINVTNDAWFGLSTGPHQHFQMARMRAVEQGIPLIRVANTGITAIVDPFGSILSRIELGSAGIADSQLPKAIDKTTYAQYNNLFLLLLVVLAAILTIRQRKTQKY